MEGLLQTGETFQSSVHAGGSYAEAYRRETTQMHGKSTRQQGPVIFSSAEIGMRN